MKWLNIKYYFSIFYSLLSSTHNNCPRRSLDGTVHWLCLDSEQRNGDGLHLGSINDNITIGNVLNTTGNIKVVDILNIVLSLFHLPGCQRSEKQILQIKVKYMNFQGSQLNTARFY